MSVVDTMHSKRVTDEARHANDDLEYFYLEAKRNKRIAKWAAKRLGIDRKQYFLELISEDISRAGPKPVVDRIMKNFREAQIDIPEEEVWERLRKYEKVILKDMMDAHTQRIRDQFNAQSQVENIKNKYRKKKKKK